ACNLTRNLMLVGELLQFDRPVVVALNMVDLAQRRGLTLDATRLAGHLGCPVVPLVARRGIGIDALRAVLGRTVPGERGERVMSSDGDDDLVASATTPVKIAPPALADGLEEWADQIVDASVGGSAAVGSATDTLTERLDKAFTHPVLGLLVFAGVMGA